MLVKCENILCDENEYCEHRKPHKPIEDGCGNFCNNDWDCNGFCCIEFKEDLDESVKKELDGIFDIC